MEYKLIHNKKLSALIETDDPCFFNYKILFSSTWPDVSLFVCNEIVYVEFHPILVFFKIPNLMVANTIN